MDVSILHVSQDSTMTNGSRSRWDAGVSVEYPSLPIPLSSVLFRIVEHRAFFFFFLPLTTHDGVNDVGWSGTPVLVFNFLIELFMFLVAP